MRSCRLLRFGIKMGRAFGKNVERGASRIEVLHSGPRSPQGKSTSCSMVKSRREIRVQLVQQSRQIS